MEEKKLVPKKRFKGFEQHWGLYQFDTKFNVVSGNAFKLNEYISSGVPIINGESIQNGFVKSNNIHYLPKNYLERFESIKLLKGDIVLGLNRPIINNKLKISLVPYTLNESLLYQRAGKIINIKKIHQYFSYRLLEKHIYQFVLKEAVGSDQPFISTNILKETTIIIPTEEMEQQKIGEFFKVLDERIANQERKIAKVKALKEAYLTEMFPQEGETVPKRRFKGFEGEWEYKSLESLLSDIIDNRGKTPPLNPEGKYSLIEVASLGGRNPDYANVTKYIDKRTYDSFLRGYISENDVLYSTVGRIGLVSLMDNNHFANIAQNIVGFRFKVNVCSNYMFALLSHKTSKKNATKIVMGAVQPSIKVTQLVHLKFLIPKTYDEQQKIGSFFKNLDDQIRVEEAKLEKLKKMKEAYLEEMFV